MVVHAVRGPSRVRSLALIVLGAPNFHFLFVRVAVLAPTTLIGAVVGVPVPWDGCKAVPASVANLVKATLNRWGKLLGLP